LLDGVFTQTPVLHAHRGLIPARGKTAKSKDPRLKIAQIRPVFLNLLTRYRDTAARGFIQG